MSRKITCLFFVALSVFASLYAESFDEMVYRYPDEIEKDEDDRVVKITSYDGSYEVLKYGAFSDKAERIDSYNRDGKLIDSVVFYRDAQSGELLAYKKKSLNVFFAASADDTNVFLKGVDDKYSTFNTFFSSLVVPGDENGIEYKFNEDKTKLEITRGGVKSVYGDDGRMLQSGDSFYIYDDSGRLTAVEKRNGDVIVQKTLYENSAAKEVVYYENGVVRRRVVFNASGNDEEYYENGKLYAVASYFDDNKKVKSIKYVE